jgi:hypothetical protein
MATWGDMSIPALLMEALKLASSTKPVYAGNCVVRLLISLLLCKVPLRF